MQHQKVLNEMICSWLKCGTSLIAWMEKRPQYAIMKTARKCCGWRLAFCSLADIVSGLSLIVFEKDR